MKEDNVIELEKYFKDEEILKFKDLRQGETIQVKGILPWHQIGSESTILGDKHSKIQLKDQSDRVFTVTIKDFQVMEPKRHNSYREVEFLLER